MGGGKYMRVRDIEEKSVSPPPPLEAATASNGSANMCRVMEYMEMSFPNGNTDWATSEGTITFRNAANPLDNGTVTLHVPLLRGITLRVVEATELSNVPGCNVDLLKVRLMRCKNPFCKLTGEINPSCEICNSTKRYMDRYFRPTSESGKTIRHLRQLVLRKSIRNLE